MDFSFSGLKTSFLYLVRDHLAKDPDFIEKEKAHLAASMQHHIILSLIKKMKVAIKQYPCADIALSGGVAANSGLRAEICKLGKKFQKNVIIPPMALTTDNAAMVAGYGYFKFIKEEFTSVNTIPYSSNQN